MFLQTLVVHFSVYFHLQKDLISSKTKFCEGSWERNHTKRRGMRGGTHNTNNSHLVFMVFKDWYDVVRAALVNKTKGLQTFAEECTSIKIF